MPLVELTAEEISLVKESLGYSKNSVDNGGATYELKQKKLAEIEVVLSKLRQAS